MMEANYRPRGWLGLIMGTRLYYKFFGKKLQQESAFEGQMDMLVREIGDRGKVGLSEAVPPTPAPAPDHTAAPTWAPAPAPAPAPVRAAPAPTPAPAPEPAPVALVPAPTPQAFSPSVQRSPASTQLQSTDALPLMERMLEQVVEQDTKARMELEAKLEISGQAMEKLREELVEAKIQAAKAEVRAEIAGKQAISDAQLSALQARLEALHEAKLLSEEELFSLEDLCADHFDLQAKVGVVTKEMTTLHTLVSLSEGIPKDNAFARQCRRKFC